MPISDVGATSVSYRTTITNLIYPGPSETNMPKNLSTFSQKDGADNPRWREAVKNGVDAGSPYTRKKVWANSGRVSVKALRSRNGKPYLETTFDGYHWMEGVNLSPYMSFDVPAFTQVRGAAIAKFYSKVSETITPLKGLVVLGELKETLRLLASLLIDGLKVMMTLRRELRGIWVQLRQELNRLKSKSERSAAVKRSLKEASARYLQFTFGIEPLIADIESAVVVLNERGLRREVIRASVKSHSSSDSQAEYLLAYSSFYALVGAKSTTKLVSRVVGVVEFERPGLGIESIKPSELGISLREVVPALWELTPFSFLVDYFVNISHVLNTAMYADTKLVYAWVSTKSDRSAEVKFSSVRPNQAYPWVITRSVLGAPLKCGAFHFERKKVDPIDARVRLSIPPMGRKWLNMFALLVQNVMR